MFGMSIEERVMTTSPIHHKISLPIRQISPTLPKNSSMVIVIRKSEIFQEVEKRSSLEAAGMPEAYDQVWASLYEGGFLDTYWVEGCTSVIELLKRYIRNNTVVHSLTTYQADEELRIEADMPFRYNELLTGSVTTDIKMLLASRIMSRWMAVKVPERAAGYEQEALQYAADLRIKLTYRNEPEVNISHEPQEDDVRICQSDEDEPLLHKSMDRLILTQYERCNHHFESGRNHERRDECGPCHRP